MQLAASSTTGWYNTFDSISVRRATMSPGFKKQQHARRRRPLGANKEVNNAGFKIFKKLWKCFSIFVRAQGYPPPEDSTLFNASIVCFTTLDRVQCSCLLFFRYRRSSTVLWVFGCVCVNITWTLLNSLSVFPRQISKSKPAQFFCPCLCCLRRLCISYKHVIASCVLLILQLLTCPAGPEVDPRPPARSSSRTSRTHVGTVPSGSGASPPEPASPAWLAHRRRTGWRSGCILFGDCRRKHRFVQFSDIKVCKTQLKHDILKMLRVRRLFGLYHPMWQVISQQKPSFHQWHAAKEKKLRCLTFAV